MVYSNMHYCIRKEVKTVYIVSYKYSPEDWAPYYITEKCDTWEEVQHIIDNVKTSDCYSDVSVEENCF